MKFTVNDLDICSLTSLLTLTPIQTPLNPSRLQVLPDRSRLYYITSRSRAYLLSLFHCRLIIIILNPNLSLSLSTLSYYNSGKVTDITSCLQQSSNTTTISMSLLSNVCFSQILVTCSQWILNHTVKLPRQKVLLGLPNG